MVKRALSSRAVSYHIELNILILTPELNFPRFDWTTQLVEHQHLLIMISAIEEMATFNVWNVIYSSEQMEHWSHDWIFIEIRF